MRLLQSINYRSALNANHWPFLDQQYTDTWERQRFDWTDQSDLIEIAKKVEMPFGIP
jgi:hypothetical protein